TIISMRRTCNEPTLYIDPNIRIRFINDVRSGGKYRTNLENKLANIPSLIFDKTEDLYSGISLLIDLNLIKIIRSISNSVLISTFPGLAKNLIKYAYSSNLNLV